MCVKKDFDPPQFFCVQPKPVTDFFDKVWYSPAAKHITDGIARDIAQHNDWVGKERIQQMGDAQKACDNSDNGPLYDCKWK